MVKRCLLLERKAITNLKVKVTQSCPTLCDPIDFTVHEILQARILQWVAYPFSSGSSQPRNRTRVSCIAGGFFTNWTFREAHNQPRQHIKKQRHYSANNGLSSQSYNFASILAYMWDLHHKESWTLKNWCFWTMMLDKTLESPLECKEIQPVHPKGNQSWIFIGRADAETETPILWPPDVKNWLIWGDPDARKDWRQEEKGTTEDETVGCPWGHKESDMTEQLNWTELSAALK